MTLCGPATEACTYVLLAPALAWALLGAASDRWPLPVRMMTGTSFGLLMVCVLAGLWSGANRIHALGLHPLGGLFLIGAYLMVLVRALTAARSRSSADAPERPGSRRLKGEPDTGERRG